MWKIGLFFFLGLFSVACRDIDKVPSGELIFDYAYKGYDSLSDVPASVRLSVDRAMQKAIFTQADGTQQPFSLILNSEPPVSACQTNFSGSLLEVVRTDLAELVVGDVRIVQPILVAHCGIDGPATRLTLRTTSSSGFPNIDCSADADAVCLIFKLP